MTGRLNGAVKRLQRKQLEVQENEAHKCEAVGCHCAAHQLNLAAQQAGDSAYMKKFKDVLRQLFDFFHNSAVRSAGLLAIQKLLGSPELNVLDR